MIARHFVPPVHTYGGPGLIGALVCLVVAFLLLVAVALLVAWYIRRHPASASAVPTKADQGPAAREVIALRYARGEITREQYLQLLADLGQQSSS